MTKTFVKFFFFFNCREMWRLRYSNFFPVSCHLGPKGLNGKIVLIRFVHVHKKYKTRVGDRQRKSGYCGILAQKVSVRPSARINYAPLSNLTITCIWIRKGFNCIKRTQ